MQNTSTEHSDEDIPNVPEEEEAVSLEKINRLLHVSGDALVAKTIKKCIPQENSKCKTFVPENSGQRITLLAPPGSLTDFFSKLVEKTIQAAGSKTKDGVSIEWLPTSHMAPYGYGKTHGWTKIIRVVPEPIMLGAADSLLAHYPEPSIPPLDDLKASLRQTIRYHCRLNHIAAHTSLLTLSWNEISEVGLKELIEKVESFLNLEHGEGNSLDTELNSLTSEREKNVSDVSNKIFKMVNLVDGIDFMSYSSITNDVIKDEMQLSKDLTAWPCQSFWTVGEDETDRLKLSPAISDIAKAISPDCESEMNDCFVKRDKCEAKGDGECK
ncbi:unnamed protein product [Cylindrotheca closterium]|uniref:Uncharacterized protein n=1 Tax=Cylindrotheca closterium TaxID=2856 RepID=A0AAD2JHB7_9STRA|nr:unnamed protein product [Cylindrotheca closterium]